MLFVQLLTLVPVFTIYVYWTPLLHSYMISINAASLKRFRWNRCFLNVFTSGTNFCSLRCITSACIKNNWNVEPKNWKSIFQTMWWLICSYFVLQSFLYFATDDEVNNLQSKSGAKNLIESYGMHCVQIGDNYT